MEGPGWFSAITCNRWVRLEDRPLDSACFFGTQLLYFQPWGRFLGPPIPDLDPGWAGDLFCPDMGPGKTWFCGRNGPPWGCTGFCKRGMDCMVRTQETFGQRRFPPNPPRKSFPRPSRISGPVRGPPWGSMVAPYCPFVGQWAIQLPMDPPWWAG